MSKIDTLVEAVQELAEAQKSARSKFMDDVVSHSIGIIIGGLVVGFGTIVWTKTSSMETTVDTKIEKAMTRLHEQDESIKAAVDVVSREVAAMTMFREEVEDILHLQSGGDDIFGVEEFKLDDLEEAPPLPDPAPAPPSGDAKDDPSTEDVKKLLDSLGEAQEESGGVEESAKPKTVNKVAPSNAFTPTWRMKRQRDIEQDIKQRIIDK